MNSTYLFPLFKENLKLFFSEYTYDMFKDNKIRWIVKCLYENPFRVHNDAFEFIFIHIPKAAGMSLQYSLFPGYPRVGHRPALLYRIYDPNKFSKYYKFSFIRNPFDRLVSAYFFLKSGGITPYDQMWAKKNIPEDMEFKEFVNKLRSHRYSTQVLKHQHFRPQYKWICDKEHNILLDDVFHFENIEESFKVIKSKLSLNKNLRLIHKNSSNHIHYKELYTAKLTRIVEALYSEDIELFYTKRGR